MVNHRVRVRHPLHTQKDLHQALPQPLLPSRQQIRNCNETTNVVSQIVADHIEQCYRIVQTTELLVASCSLGR